MTDPKRGRRTGMAAAAGRRAESGAPAPGATAARARPVRMTIEVPPELFRSLTSWTHEVMVETGATRVTISDAVRAMIRLTLADDAMAAAVRAQMETDRER